MPEGRQYCSLPCYRANPRPQRKTGETRDCTECGTAFYVPKSRAMKGEGMFCTLACHNRNQGRNKTSHTCKMCGGVFKWSPSRSASGNYTITYCSLACRDADPSRADLLMRMNETQQLRNPTRAEVAGYAILDSLGVEYSRQTRFGGKFTPDAVVPSARLVIQFDGDYWHDRNGTSSEARILRRVALDRSQDAYIRACGWEVVRLWDSDLRTNPAACAEAVSQALRRTLEAEPSQDPLAQA
jgi:DNA mismatch endonuclease (patch repair protein)